MELIRSAIINKALIIDVPWINEIWSHSKVWEMRSRNCQIRGWVGLIQKGTGRVCGIAYLQDTIGPLSDAEMRMYHDKHLIPERLYTGDKFSKHRWAWCFSSAIEFKNPIPYIHKKGAIIWVNLDDEAVKNVASYLKNEL